MDDLTLTPLVLSEIVSIAAQGKEIPNTKMGMLREVVHLPDADPTHHGALEIAPLSGQADVYLITLASAMTMNSQTQILEREAKQTTNERLRQMRELGEADGTATVLQVLGALVDHHVLEGIEYPAVAYRFEHQQMQEYYAAEFVKQELFGLVAGANRSESLDAIATTSEAKSFQVKYVNQSSWSEPLCMVAGDLDDDSSSSEPDKQLIQAKAALVLLALDVDLVFAAELFGLCTAKVRALVAEKLYAAIHSVGQALKSLFVLRHWKR